MDVASRLVGSARPLVLLLVLLLLVELLWLLYLPVSTPPPSGDHTATPRSKARAIGSRSRSGVRSIRLYSICRAMKGVLPERSARLLACATIQAGVLEMPI